MAKLDHFSFYPSLEDKKILQRDMSSNLLMQDSNIIIRVVDLKYLFYTVVFQFKSNEILGMNGFVDGKKACRWKGMESRGVWVVECLWMRRTA